RTRLSIGSVYETRGTIEATDGSPAASEPRRLLHITSVWRGPQDIDRSRRDRSVWRDSEEAEERPGAPVRRGARRRDRDPARPAGRAVDRGGGSARFRADRRR